MRIIAGSARGTPLLAPKGMDTRPTQDKVKESLFNMLQGQLEDGAALDLFAGSGALGLEAVSRSAAPPSWSARRRSPPGLTWKPRN